MNGHEEIAKRMLCLALMLCLFTVCIPHAFAAQKYEYKGSYLRDAVEKPLRSSMGLAYSILGIDMVNSETFTGGKHPMLKNVMKAILLLIALLLLAFLVPSGAILPAAFAQEAAQLPKLEPVELSGDIAPLPLEGNAPYAPQESGYGADGLSYHDDSLDIRIYKTRAYDTPVFVAYVQIADASQLRTEQAKAYPSPAMARTDVMAKRVGAVIACNADYFIFHRSGIVYRKGELLRDRPNEEFDALAIDENGDFHMIAPLTAEGFAAIGSKIVTSFCFGPALVIDGEIHEDVGRDVTYKQRMGIAQVGKLSYMLVATDGPEEKDSVGLSIPQFSQLMKDLGAIHAYNLDGGSSTCMMFHGAKVNGQKAGKVRSIGDIVYFATAVAP